MSGVTFFPFVCHSQMAYSANEQNCLLSLSLVAWIVRSAAS